MSSWTIMWIKQLCKFPWFWLCSWLLLSSDSWRWTFLLIRNYLWRRWGRLRFSWWVSGWSCLWNKELSGFTRFWIWLLLSTNYWRWRLLCIWYSLWWRWGRLWFSWWMSSWTCLWVKQLSSFTWFWSWSWLLLWTFLYISWWVSRWSYLWIKQLPSFTWFCLRNWLLL